MHFITVHDVRTIVHDHSMHACATVNLGACIVSEL